MEYPGLGGGIVAAAAASSSSSNNNKILSIHVEYLNI
jgi:hypothetical protein